MLDDNTYIFRKLYRCWKDYTSVTHCNIQNTFKFIHDDKFNEFLNQVYGFYITDQQPINAKPLFKIIIINPHKKLLFDLKYSQ